MNPRAMRLLLPAVVLLACSTRAIAEPVAFPSAIFASHFDDRVDTNYDRWPDHWTRETGPTYPHYTQVEIADDPTAEDGRSLQVVFDGGGAYLSTPAIPILPNFGYKLLVRVKSENLVHTPVRVQLELQSHGRETLQVETTDPIRSTGQWQTITIGPFRPDSQQVERAVVRFDAPRGRRGDLAGRLSIDHVVLERLPSMTVRTGSRYNVYNDFREVKVECTLSGIREQNPEIRFQLLDETSREIKGKSTTNLLPGRLIMEDSLDAHDIVGAIGDRPSGYEGTTYWTPDIEDYGFYRIRVKMLSENRDAGDLEATDYDRELEERVITLAVLPKLPRPSHGEFGWTLPVGDKPLPFSVLSDLLPRVGVHWVKVPVWYPVEDRERGEEIVRFAERISSAGIELVGILDSPLVEDYWNRDPNQPTDIADLLLSDPSFWQPQLEHVMSRLSLRLRWWQLGNDWDTSFYGYRDLVDKLQAVHKQLFRFGQDVKLGLGWRWPQASDELEWVPPPVDGAWDFEQMSADPPLSAAELQQAMANVPRTDASRWVQVDPSPRAELNASHAGLTEAQQVRLHEDHVREFVRQMVVAKMGGADGIFVANPFTGPEGVMNTDGTPGALLLPWRTTAHLLGGRQYLGDLELPSGSTNHVFAGSDGEVVMIVWNDTPTTELLYLGEQVEKIDVWGKRTSLAVDDQGQVRLEIDRLPSFVVGLNPAVTRWRMAVQFDAQRVPSIFSHPHENNLRGLNSFPQGVNGRFSIFVPWREGAQSPQPIAGKNQQWTILPDRGQFAVGAGDSFQVPLQLMLDEATHGPQPVRIDFEVEADELYKFSVWRNLHVGLGDVSIGVRTWIDERGQLVVEQQMANTGPRAADFKCLLYAPPRRRQQTQVVMLGADGNKKIYKYPRGEELIGNVLKLRAEEVNGRRVLIHRFVATRGEPDDPAPADDPPPHSAL